MTELTTKGECTYGENDVVHKAQDEKPALCFGPRGARTVTVEFAPQSAQLVPRILAFKEKGIAFHSTRCADLARRILREIRSPDSFTSRVLQMLTAELMIEVMRQERSTAGQPPWWVQEVRNLIVQGTDRRPTLVELAREAQVHPAHLSQVFRKHYGESIGQFIRRASIDRAAQLIKSSEKSLAQIGLELGFCDQSHFSRVFRKMTGFTPLEFRRLFSRT